MISEFDIVFSILENDRVFINFHHEKKRKLVCIVWLLGNRLLNSPYSSVLWKVSFCFSSSLLSCFIFLLNFFKNQFFLSFSVFTIWKINKIQKKFQMLLDFFMCANEIPPKVCVMTITYLITSLSSSKDKYIITKLWYFGAWGKRMKFSPIHN